jgi:hypothetical protein
MTKPVSVHPFSDAEAFAWLRSQVGGSVAASAAGLGRQWGWNRVRASRRLKAWQVAGHIRRRGHKIVVIGGVSDAVTAGVTGTVAPGLPTAAPRTSPVSRATLLAALALACVSAGFSIDGLTTIFVGAFWPVIMMSVALEAGELVATAWLTEHWRTAPRPLRLVLVAMIAVLMGLNPVGVFGFLTRARLDHTVTADLALTDRAVDIKARLALQIQAVADLDRRIGQIDAAVEELTRRGRPAGAMMLAGQQRRARADLDTARQAQARSLAATQIEEAKIDAQRRRIEADVGPVRYLAELIGSVRS